MSGQEGYNLPGRQNRHGSFWMTDNTDLYNPKPSGIVIYSASWCPDCKRSKRLLDEHKIKYIEVDIGKDNAAFMFVEKLTRRVRIPTIVFPDGTLMVEPENAELGHKLGLA
jgi:glutaredoxin